MQPLKVGIVILNWNGWRDTIECLESVLRLDHPNVEVVVCDNGSTDGSVEQLLAWAAGRLEVAPEGPAVLAHYVQPPVPKPVTMHRCTGVEDATPEGAKDAAGCRLTLLETGANLGYAAGNNAGIRLLLRHGADYVWVLNNDTVVTPDAVTRLIERMQEKPAAGMCGSKLLYYWQPDRIQALGGGAYNVWSARSQHLAVDERDGQPFDIGALEQQAAYIVGAAMFASRRFIETVGLLNEAYFLFFEEVDWALRGRQHGFSLAIAEKSVVYHKEGGSTGSSSDPGQMSALADYYSNQSRLRFTRQYYPYLLPVLYGRFLIALGNRWRRHQTDRIPLLLKVMLNR